MRKLLFVMLGLGLGYLVCLAIVGGLLELLPSAGKGTVPDTAFSSALDISLIGAIIGAAIGWYAAQETKAKKRKY